MELNYEEIRRIYRLEKNSSQLTELDENFYLFLTDFIQKEKKNYFESLKKASLSDSRNFSNLKKLVEEIFFIREKKILNKALISSRMKKRDDKGLASEEKKTFNQLVDVIEKHMMLLEKLFEQKNTTVEEKELIQVNILEDVPSFIAADMKEYGPFKKKEKIKIPSKVALLLLERNLAERI